MKLYGYCYYNRKAGYYTPPIWNQYPKELMLEIIERSYAEASADEQAKLQECDFTYLGEFDDKSGIFNLELKPEFLRNFTEVKKEDAKNG